MRLWYLLLVEGVTIDDLRLYNVRESRLTQSLQTSEGDEVWRAT